MMDKDPQGQTLGSQDQHEDCSVAVFVLPKNRNPEEEFWLL